MAPLGAETPKSASRSDSNLLLQKYQTIESDDPSGTAELKKILLATKPEWDKYDCTRAGAGLLNLLELDAPPLTSKAIIQSHRDIMKHAMEALQVPDVQLQKWMMMAWYDMLREDSSCFSLFEFAAKANVPVFSSFMGLLKKSNLDPYVADKASWILSSVIGHASSCFNDGQVEELLGLVGPGSSVVSPMASLEAIVNILKADNFRIMVFNYPNIADTILKVPVSKASPGQLYKCAFAIWMFSFNEEIMQEMKNDRLKDVPYVITLIKELLVNSRTEKVIRLCLTVIRNLIAHKDLSEDVVENGILDAVQQLEYEKWRDADLYTDIQEVAQLISVQVAANTSFERYEKELHSGCLHWGFIHSEQFWKENIKKFEQDNFKSVKLLCTLLLQEDHADLETTAVACHDVGQFVALHPLGKKIVAQYEVKDRVMKLMSSSEPGKRDVRREALMCCQKMMLNNWQGLA